MDFPGGPLVRNPPAEEWIWYPVQEDSQRRQWQPTPGLLLGKSHGQRSLVGCSPWGHLESDTTEWLHFHFSFSCVGEGNGNPLQGSCLENPRDGGAWWAAVYGVAQSRTRLKRLSSGSSQEDSIGHRATKPKRHNDRACALEPTRSSPWACVPLTPQPARSRAHALQPGKPAVRSPCTATKGEPPLTATRDSLCTAMKTQNRQKLIFVKDHRPRITFIRHYLYIL